MKNHIRFDNRGLLKLLYKNQKYRIELITGFKTLVDNLVVTYNPKYPNSEFYGRNGNILFELNKTVQDTLYLWVNYKLWDVIENVGRLEYDEIQEFIRSQMFPLLCLDFTPVYAGDDCWWVNKSTE